MAIPKHLEEATARLEAAQAVIRRLRSEKTTQENLRQWLEALADTCAALADIQAFGNESVHEKLHRLADHVKMPGLS